MQKLSPNVVVSVSKVNGNEIRLFNVRRDVGKWIEIDIQPAKVVERLGGRVVLPESKSILTLRMTNEQLIGMLASAGEYGGTPATLVYLKDHEIGPVEPEVSEFEQAVMDFKRKMVDMVTASETSIMDFERFIDSLNISKVRKDTALELIDNVFGHLNKYGRDVLVSLVESVEKIREKSGIEK